VQLAEALNVGKPFRLHAIGDSKKNWQIGFHMNCLTWLFKIVYPSFASLLSRHKKAVFISNCN